MEKTYDELVTQDHLLQFMREYLAKVDAGASLTRKEEHHYARQIRLHAERYEGAVKQGMALVGE